MSAALLAMLSVGCADAIGLSDLVYERDPTVVANGGGGAGGEGGTGGTGGEPPPCEGFVFGDDFEDEVGPEWMEAANAATIGVDGGQLLLDGSAPGLARIDSLAPYDAATGTFAVELVQGVPDGDTAVASLGLQAATGTLLVQHFGNQRLHFAFQVSITTNVLWEGDYDPIAHRFVRIRGTETQRIFEASEDGESWNEIAAIDEGTLPELVGIQVSLGYSGNSDPIQVRFDNLLVCGG